jgi:hypothetical protein
MIPSWKDVDGFVTRLGEFIERGVAAMEGMRRERGEGREFQPRAMEGRNK